MAKNKVVFIDRDGVINVDPMDYITRWEDFRFEKGALESLKKLTELGYEIIVISNQAGIGDGVYPEASLWDIHEKMLGEFRRHGIRIRSAHYCLHGKEAGCGCRKPETGLFEEAVRGLEFDRSQTYFIGDKVSDVEAGKRFGLRTIFVRTGHGREDEAKLGGRNVPDHIVDALPDAVALLKS